MPFFRDSRGVLCAMAYLIDRSGRGDLVDRVTSTRNNAFIPELAGDPELRTWLDSGRLFGGGGGSHSAVVWSSPRRTGGAGSQRELRAHLHPGQQLFAHDARVERDRSQQGNRMGWRHSRNRRTCCRRGAARRSRRDGGCGECEYDRRGRRPDVRPLSAVDASAGQLDCFDQPRGDADRLQSAHRLRGTPRSGDAPGELLFPPSRRSDRPAHRGRAADAHPRRRSRLCRRGGPLRHLAERHRLPARRTARLADHDRRDRGHTGAGRRYPGAATLAVLRGPARDGPPAGPQDGRVVRRGTGPQRHGVQCASDRGLPRASLPGPLVSLTGASELRVERP